MSHVLKSELIKHLFIRRIPAANVDFVNLFSFIIVFVNKYPCKPHVHQYIGTTYIYHIIILIGVTLKLHNMLDPVDEIGIFAYVFAMS